MFRVSHVCSHDRLLGENFFLISPPRRKRKPGLFSVFLSVRRSSGVMAFLAGVGWNAAQGYLKKQTRVEDWCPCRVMLCYLAVLRCVVRFILMW